jgi:hypothetical protein
MCVSITNLPIASDLSSANTLPNQKILSNVGNITVNQVMYIIEQLYSQVQIIPESVIALFIKLSAIDINGKVSKPEKISKLCVALISMLKKLSLHLAWSKLQILMQNKNEIIVTMDSILSPITTKMIPIFSTLISMCSTIEPFKNQHSAILPTQDANNSLIFGYDVLRFDTLPELATRIVANFESLLSTSTFGMKLPDEALLVILPNSPKGSPPVTRAGIFSLCYLIIVNTDHRLYFK